MAHVLRETHPGRYEAADDDYRVERSARYGIANIIAVIGGVIVTLLGLRFLLMLLGANSGNAFVSFIYSVTQPLAAPFFGIFNYQQQVGIARFEFETLIAMAIYGLITWVIIRLVAGFSR